MNREYTYTITCTYKYYGYPQAERHYIINSGSSELKLEWYGNHGFDIPKIINNHRQCNGYFWDTQALMNALYRDQLRLLSDLNENETRTLKLEEDPINDIYETRWLTNHK